MPRICVPSAEVSPAMPSTDVFIAGPNVPHTDVDKVAVEIPIFIFFSVLQGVLIPIWIHSYSIA